MRERYDVVIVGSGPAGIFAALEVARRGNKKILLVERGSGPTERFSRRTTDGRAWVTGWGGAGAYSDGKLTLTPDVGGVLGDIVGLDRLLALIEQVDRIYVEAGAPGDTSGDESPELLALAERAQRARLRFVPTRVRHMGTDTTQGVLRRLYDQLAGRVDMLFSTGVKSIRVAGSGFQGVELEDGRDVAADFGIVAPGRAGSAWLKGEAGRLGLTTRAAEVDIGVRIELPAAILADVTRITHEVKLLYHSRSFDDRVRTFCVNPYGEVVEEASEGILTVNGHSYKNRRTPCTNFAILVSSRFTEPFDDPITYGRAIARMANLLAGGVMVQRLGDLRAGRRSTPERIRRSIIQPTLSKATPGDLSFVLPYRHLTGILEMIEALDEFAPGIDAPHALLYGVEVKFYSVRFPMNERLESAIPGLFLIGDGAGISRGLVQASASGLVAADAILAA
ncbi:MAG: FAD-dependent protein [Acidobacteriota bacterium]